MIYRFTYFCLLETIPVSWLGILNHISRIVGTWPMREINRVHWKFYEMRHEIDVSPQWSYIVFILRANIRLWRHIANTTVAVSSISCTVGLQGYEIFSTRVTTMLLTFIYQMQWWDVFTAIETLYSHDLIYFPSLRWRTREIALDAERKFSIKLNFFLAKVQLKLHFSLKHFYRLHWKSDNRVEKSGYFLQAYDIFIFWQKQEKTFLRLLFKFLRTQAWIVTNGFAFVSAPRVVKNELHCSLDERG